MLKLHFAWKVFLKSGHLHAMLKSRGGSAQSIWPAISMQSSSFSVSNSPRRTNTLWIEKMVTTAAEKGLSECNIQFSQVGLGLDVDTMCGCDDCSTANISATTAPWFNLFLCMTIPQQRCPRIIVDGCVFPANYLIPRGRKLNLKLNVRNAKTIMLS